jgi:phospholipid transport system substrate-binding protein
LTRLTLQGEHSMSRTQLIALTLWLALSAPLQAADQTPQATVEMLHAALLEAMQKGPALGFDGRAALLAPVLGEVFDFETIARVVTGRHWATLAADKRREFIDVFARLSTATYAENFKAHAGEKFETRGSESRKNAELVRTVLVKTDGKEISLNYLLAEDGVWRIVNVIAEGVSDLSLKRAEYTAVIGSDGIDGLIAKLNAKVASYNGTRT